MQPTMQNAVNNRGYRRSIWHAASWRARIWGAHIGSICKGRAKPADGVSRYPRWPKIADRTFTWYSVHRLARGDLTEDEIETWPLFDDIRRELLGDDPGP